MHRVRGLLTFSVLVILSGISLAAMVHVARQGLPERAIVDRSEVRAWLVQRNVQEASGRTRERLVAHLENDFRTGFSWQEELLSMTPAEQQQFNENFNLLMEQWFMSKVDGYFAIEPPDRNRYLDREISSLMSWQAISAVDTSELNAPRQFDRRVQLGFFGELMQKIHQWRRDAEPERRKQISEFLLAVQDRILTRNLQRLGPF